MSGTRRLPLRRRDGSIRAHALVDAEDFEWLNRMPWCVNSDGYAIRVVRFGGAQYVVLLHRLVMGLDFYDPERRQVDHINRDRLDNRKTNLRVVTIAQQRQNQRSHRGSSSRFRGVSWDRRRGRWEAHARVDGRKYFLGYFDDEEEAARRAAEWRQEHMPYAID